jgi:hypothetical protein
VLSRFVDAWSQILRGRLKPSTPISDRLLTWFVTCQIISCWLYVLLFHYVIVRTTRGETKVFLYFVQVRARG